MIITDITVHNHREKLQLARAKGGVYSYVPSEIEKAGTKKTRIYVSAKDWNVMDNFLDRLTTGGKKAKELHKQIREDGTLARFLKAMEIKGKVRWDSHAGCSSCPCSPGFVIDNDADVVGDKGREIWITVTPSTLPGM
jgi:hypothetical protein